MVTPKEWPPIVSKYERFLFHQTLWDITLLKKPILVKTRWPNVDFGEVYTQKTAAKFQNTFLFKTIRGPFFWSHHVV